MGGAKKLSMAQAEKQQKMQTGKQEKQPASPKGKPTIEKKVGSIELPNLTEKDLLAELSKMRAVTPFQVASKYNVKIGVAKNLLERMAQRGHITMVSRNGSVKIYKALVAA
jgi:small subunit ribosomal protein S25e